MLAKIFNDKTALFWILLAAALAAKAIGLNF